jgi:ketosteroid isomerase-like protein
MKTIIITIFVCAFIVASSFKAIGEEWTPEQKEVIETVKAIWEASKNGDVEAIMAMKHDDVVEWWSDHSFPIKKEDSRFNYKGWIQYEKPKSYNLEFYQINIFNNVANVFFSYKYEGKGGTPFKGRSIITLIKKDNKWLDIGGLSSSCDYRPPCPY